MKKYIIKILKILIISFLGILIMTLILNNNTELACSVVLAFDGLYIVTLLTINYIMNFKRYKSGEKLPAYVKFILGTVMVTMVSEKSFHTQYTAVKTIGESTDELQSNRKSVIPIIVYTLIMISIILFVSFVFLFSIIEYTKFKEKFTQVILLISFLSIVIAVLISLLSYIYNIKKRTKNKS